jgi:hypothetical protein
MQEELINVGQKNSALQALHDVITSKVRNAALAKPGFRAKAATRVAARLRAWAPVFARRRAQPPAAWRAARQAASAGPQRTPQATAASGAVIAAVSPRAVA